MSDRSTPLDAAAAELLADVLARYDAGPDRRLADVVRAAVRHLHAFVREVRPSTAEWLAAIRFLTETGQISDGVRQEFILLSDTLGVSSLVELLAHGGAEGATEATVLGPFYVPGSPTRGRGESMVVDEGSGDPVVVRGRVTDPAGTPVAGAVLDAWQNTASGFYACQQPGVQHPDNLRGVYHAGDDGTYELRGVRPTPYPVPDDGPAGALLKANGRNWMRPAHLHLMVSAPGFRTLVTHVFDAESAHLDDDAVFGVRPGLVRLFAPDEHGELATTFDVVLTPG